MSEIKALVQKLGDKAAIDAALTELEQAAAQKEAGNEPALVSGFDAILEATGDKNKKTRDAAEASAKAIVGSVSPFAIDLLLPSFVKGLSVKAKPTQKESTLKIITHLSTCAADAVRYVLKDLVSPIAELTCDIKKEVKAAAVECMTAVSGCTGNKDLEPFLPAVVEAAQSIQNTHKCVDALAGCVFVQNVETPALAVMIPVLTRGLNDKKEEVKRTCCLIVDNMCKVVEDPAAVLPVMALLEPLVRSATEQIADPEARSVAERAYKTLKKSAEGAESKVVTAEFAQTAIKGILGDKC